MNEILTACEQAARLGGKLLVEMQSSINPREKAPRDLVTEADLASQSAIHQHLSRAYPDFDFLGEEGNETEAKSERNSDYCWIVDPLDGTTNYVHGLDNYCVSVALQHRRRIVLGAIYDPVRAELFTAMTGQGAYRNGARLQVSNIDSLDAALVAASMPAHVAPDSPEVDRFVALLCSCQALRRLGSAALNLCYVAAGQLDGYWATSVKKWDVAAGVLFVQEAGGTITSIDGGDFDLEVPKFIATGSASLNRELHRILRAADRRSG